MGIPVSKVASEKGIEMIDLSKPLVVVHEDGSVEHVQLAKRENGKTWPNSDGEVVVITKQGKQCLAYITGKCHLPATTLRNATSDEILAHVAAERERLDAMEAEANKPDAVTLWWREWQARWVNLRGESKFEQGYRMGKYDQPNSVVSLYAMPGFAEYAEKCVKELGL